MLIWASLYYLSTLNLLGRREPSCGVISLSNQFLREPWKMVVKEKEQALPNHHRQLFGGASRKELQFAKSVVAEK